MSIETMTTSDEAAMPQEGASTQEVAALDQGEPGSEALASAGVMVPGEEATPEEWQAFYRHMGVPEGADAYELEVPPGDEGEFAKAVAPLLHQAHLTKAQARVLSAGWNAFQKQQQEVYALQEQEQALAKQRQGEREQEALRTQWGEQFDGNVELARRAKDQFFPQEQADDVLTAIEGAIGVRATMELLLSIGRGLAEDDAAGLGRGTSSRRDAASVLFGG